MHSRPWRSRQPQLHWRLLRLARRIFFIFLQQGVLEAVFSRTIFELHWESLKHSHIEDMNASVSGVRFIDLDLGMSQLWSSWSVPAAGLCREFVARPERPCQIQFGLPTW